MREQLATAVQEWFTTEEMAEHYRRSEGTIRYWRHIGYGPKGVRSGRKVLYPRSERDRFDAELLAAVGDSRASA
jgi:hypothetical protein